MGSTLYDVPSSENTWSSNFAFDHREDETFQMTMKFADEAYFKTFGLELSAGRIYSASDTMHEVMINETAVQKLGLKNSPAKAPDDKVSALCGVRQRALPF